MDSRHETKEAMLNAIPNLKNMYTSDDDVFEVFYLTDAIAVFNSFGSAEPKTIQL